MDGYTKFTLYCIPHDPEYRLIIGRWVLLSAPAVHLIHGKCEGCRWWPIHSARIGVYYNWDSGGYEIGTRRNKNGDLQGYILRDNIEWRFDE